MLLACGAGRLRTVVLLVTSDLLLSIDDSDTFKCVVADSMLQMTGPRVNLFFRRIASRCRWRPGPSVNHAVDCGRALWHCRRNGRASHRRRAVSQKNLAVARASREAAGDRAGGSFLVLVPCVAGRIPSGAQRVVAPGRGGAGLPG